MRVIVCIFLTSPTKRIWGSLTHKKLPENWESCSHLYKGIFPKI